MAMAKTPAELNAERRVKPETVVATREGRHRVRLLDTSPPHARLIRKQADELNSVHMKDILDVVSLLCPTEHQWQSARSQVLRLLNGHHRNLKQVVTGVLEMDADQLERMTSLQKPAAQEEGAPAPEEKDKE